MQDFYDRLEHRQSEERQSIKATIKAAQENVLGLLQRVKELEQQIEDARALGSDTSELRKKLAPIMDRYLQAINQIIRLRG